MTKREQILVAALKVIGDVGYGKTTMAGVAKMADIGKSTIYEYFDSKDAMIMEAVVYFAKRWLAGLNEESWQVGHDFESILYHAISKSIQLMSKEFSKPESLFHGLQDMNFDKNVRGSYIEAMSPVMEMALTQARDLVALGQKEGLLRQEIEDVEVGFTLRTIVVLSASLLKEGPSAMPDFGKSEDEMVGYIVKYIVKALS